MNSKEVGELRRRFQPDRTAISRIYGCYVNSQKEVVSYIDESLGMMPQEEAEQYLSLLKKALSGKPGKNLIDIVFSNQQVIDSDEHRMLMALRDSGLKDSAQREAFYHQIIETLDMEESNYLILMAHDAYDVPHRGKDVVKQDDASDEVFRYIVCAICPVKDGKLELSYYSGENEFHNSLAKQIVSAPELGFLFPAFDNRAANIYNALFYNRKPDELHQEFIDGIFCTEAPMSAAEQKAAFQTALADALGSSCNMGIVQSVHERLRERIEQHKESKDPEALTVSAKDIGNILTDCGVAQEQTVAFQDRCAEEFGQGTVLSPENIIDSKRFEVKTDNAVLYVDPERSYLIETRMIDGKKYILIPADEGVEINGFAVHI